MNIRFKENLFFIILNINFLILLPVFNYLESEIGFFHTFLIFGAETIILSLLCKKIIKPDKKV